MPEKTPSTVLAPFSVNATGGGHGVITPGKDALFSGLSGAMQSAFMTFGQRPEALRPWVNASSSQAMVQANLMEIALMANDMGIDPVQMMANFDAFISINGKNVKVNAGTLLKDEWKQYDDVVLQVAQERLVGVGDLLSRGLTYSVPNALGVTVIEYETVTNVEAAQMSMDAITRGRGDLPEFAINYLPLPIVHDDFTLTIRHLTSSRRRGTPLDTLRAAMGTRNVTEFIENMLFNGPNSSTYAYGGGTIYGYTNHPSRIQFTTMADWGSSGCTGEEMLSDVTGMIQELINKKHYGPYGLYIPTAWETALMDDFKTYSDKSVRTRLMEIEQLQFIKVADKLSDNNAVMVELKPDTIRMVVGFQPMMIEWQSHGGMQFEYKIMAIMVPQIRADAEGNIGLLHGSTS